MSEATLDPADGAGKKRELSGVHRNTRDGGWGYFHLCATARCIDAGGYQALLIYVALCACESKAPPQFKAAFKASYCNIARECGLSIRTIARKLPVLVQAKLISIKSGKHSGKLAAHEANTFRILALPLVSGGHKPPYVPEVRRDGAQERVSSLQVKKKLSARSAAGEASPPTAAGEVKKKGGEYPWR